MANNDLVGALNRGLNMLKIIGTFPHGISVNELAENMGLKQSTCYNLVRTLVSSGFVQRRNGVLLPGEELLKFTRFGEDEKFNRILEENMLMLFKMFPCRNLVFAEITGDGPFITRRISQNYPVVLQLSKPEPLQLYASAAGLTALTYMEDESKLKQLTAAYPFDEYGALHWKTQEALNAMLAKFKSAGIVQLPFGQNISLRFAVPVSGQNGKLAAALSLSIAPFENTPELSEKIKTALRACAEKLAAAAGGSLM